MYKAINLVLYSKKPCIETLLSYHILYSGHISEFCHKCKDIHLIFCYELPAQSITKKCLTFEDLDSKKVKNIPCVNNDVKVLGALP